MEEKKHKGRYFARYTGEYKGKTRETCLRSIKSLLNRVWYLERAMERTDISFADSWFERIQQMVEASESEMAKPFRKPIWSMLGNKFGKV